MIDARPYPAHNTHMMYPPDMVIFDCDGVLVDSEALTADVIRTNLKTHGLLLSEVEFDDFFLGGTVMGVAEKARHLGADLASTWVDDIYEEIFATLDAAVAPIEGIEAVLDALGRAGIPFAVGSNGPHRKMQITLGRTGLVSRFGGRIYSREDVAHPKPAPDVYLKAAQDARVAPARCVVIEDSPNGARAGMAAGMTVYGYTAQTPCDRLMPVCDHLFDRMPDLPGLLMLPHTV